MCRWLLLSLDRLDGNELRMTQELIANMLGVRREGGPLAANAKFMHVGKRGNDWHFNHFLNPRQISPGSNMPSYPWLFSKQTDIAALPNKIAVQTLIGVPWPVMNQHEIRDMVETQSQEIAASLVAAKV